MKHEKNYKSTCTLQWNIQYIKVGTLKDSSSECSRFIKKAKEQTLCQKNHVKKVLEVQQILVILTLIAILITKERAVKSNQELIVEEKVIQSLGLRNL